MKQTYSSRDYVEAITAIRRLKLELWKLAEQNGTLHPDVIALSQVIDEHIVVVQQYWQQQRPRRRYRATLTESS